MKTLKDLFELYRPKAKGEQDFVDKHVVIKHKDRNGNGDDVFNGNTKVVDRKKNRQGYDTSSDEKVYEEVTHRVHGYYDAKTSRGYDTRPVSIKVKADNEDHAKKVAAQQLANHKNYKPTKVVSLGEDVEDLDELSKDTLKSYVKKSVSDLPKRGIAAQSKFDKGDSDAALKHLHKITRRQRSVGTALDKMTKEDVEDLDEAVSVSHDRYLRSHGKKASGAGAWIFTHKKYGNIDLNDDKSSHIGKGKFSDAAKSAKAWAKKHGHMTIYVAEEHADEMLRNSILEMAELEGEDLTEENLDTLVEALLDELSQKMVRAYRDKARDDKEDAEDQRDFYKAHDDNTSAEDKRIRKRSSGIKTASKKIYGFGKVNVKEEVEDLDELSRKTLSNYVRKASPKVASHAASQMTTNDIANMEYHGNKVIKRLKGINTAASKLAEEELEDLEESWSDGRFSPGSRAHRNSLSRSIEYARKAKSAKNIADTHKPETEDHNRHMHKYHSLMAKAHKEAYHADKRYTHENGIGGYYSVDDAKKRYKEHMERAKKYKSKLRNNCVYRPV